VKVLVLTHVFPPRRGGSGQWLWELYRRLTDIDVHIVAGEVEGAAAFDRQSGLRVTRMPLDFSSWGLLNWRGASDYARTLRDLLSITGHERPDAVHCGKCLPEGLLASALQRLRGIPFTVFVHGEELTLAAGSRELARLTRHVLRAATTVIANSRHTQRILVESWKVPKASIAVLTPGVDITRFVPGPPDSEVRRRLGWAGRRVILTVGALQKRKGQDMLIRALPAVRERCPDVLYAIAGEGWERAYLEEMAVTHDVSSLVQFRGAPENEELVACYQQCDLFALPNRQVGWDFEGFGMVLLEAQACGKPVIAGRSGGTPETMIEAETGELVDGDGPEELARTAAALLDDRERRTVMGARARQWVVDRFAWDVLTERAREVFTARDLTASR
jgi:phosphatidylinositol alpha-1,6-mannosyltransferase